MLSNEQAPVAAVPASPAPLPHPAAVALRTSPRKTAMSPAAQTAAPERARNNHYWTPKDDARLVVSACSEKGRVFLEKLGEVSDRNEMQASTSSEDSSPDGQFYAQLALIYNDTKFSGSLHPDWNAGDLQKLSRTILEYKNPGVSRDVKWIKEKFKTLRSRFETAWTRYQGLSGVDGKSCFCGCGKDGFFSTSGLLQKHADLLCDDNVKDDH